MKLGLYLKKLDDKDAAYEALVIDERSGAVLEKPLEFVVGKVGETLMECGLLAAGQLQPDVSYLVVIVPCEGFSSAGADAEESKAGEA
jgi:hypothetical protein